MAGGFKPASPAPLPSVAQSADGSLSIGLFLPFESAGVRRDALVLAPFSYGMTMRWQAGKFGSGLELLLELSGWKAHEIERLNRIDYPRVFKAFLDHVDPEVAEDLQNGDVPLATDAIFLNQGRARAAAAVEPDPNYPPEPPAAPGPSMDDAWAGVEDQAKPVDYIPGIDD